MEGRRALRLALPRSLIQPTFQMQMVKNYGIRYEGDAMLGARVKVITELR